MTETPTSIPTSNIYAAIDTSSSSSAVLKELIENKRKKDNKKKSEKSDAVSNVALTPAASAVEEKPISRSIEEKSLGTISSIPLDIPKPSKKEKKSENKKEKKPIIPKEESPAQKSPPTSDSLRKDLENVSDEDKMPNLVSDDEDASETIPEVNGDVSDDEKVPTLITEEDEGSDIEDQFKQYCTTVGDGAPDISLNRRDRVHAPNDQGFLTSLANTLGFGKRVDATTIRPYTHSQKEESIFFIVKTLIFSLKIKEKQGSL